MFKKALRYRTRKRKEEKERDEKSTLKQLGGRKEERNKQKTRTRAFRSEMLSGLAPLRFARYTVLGPLSDNERERDKNKNNMTRQEKGINVEKNEGERGNNNNNKTRGERRRRGHKKKEETKQNNQKTKKKRRKH